MTSSDYHFPHLLLPDPISVKIGSGVKKRKHNRKKGDRNEYKTIELLRNTGHLCVRSGGSMGPFDVIAIPSDDSPVRLIQCKSYIPRTYVKKDMSISLYAPSYDKIISDIQSYKVTNHCQKELWKWKLWKREPEILVIQ